MVQSRAYSPAGIVIKAFRAALTVREILANTYTLSRAGLRLEPSNAMRVGFLTWSNVASPYPYVVPPLAAGASQYVIDPTTGLATGFNVPVGYYGTIVALIIKPSQDVSAWIEFDGVFCGCLLWVGAGDTHYENEVVPLSSGMLDPAAAAAHNMNFYYTNEGAANLFGGCSIFLMLERVGSEPLPTTKSVICKSCRHTETVGLDVTTWPCPKCGTLNLFFNMDGYGRK